MKVRYFKQRALAKVAAGLVDNYVAKIINDSAGWLEVEPAMHTRAPAWLEDAINAAVGIQQEWIAKFNVHRKKDKAFVGEFETEAEALAVIEKAKAQKKAALYIA